METRQCHREWKACSEAPFCPFLDPGPQFPRLRPLLVSESCLPFPRGPANSPGPQALLPPRASLATQVWLVAEALGRPGPHLFRTFLLEGKARPSWESPWGTALLTGEGTEGEGGRQGDPRGLPEQGGRFQSGRGGAQKSAAFSQTSFGFWAREGWGPWCPSHLSPHRTKGPGYQALVVTDPPQGTQRLEHNRCLIIDEGHGVGAQHTQVESGGAPMRSPARAFSPHLGQQHPQRRPALLCGSHRGNAVSDLQRMIRNRDKAEVKSQLSCKRKTTARVRPSVSKAPALQRQPGRLAGLQGTEKGPKRPPPSLGRTRGRPAGAPRSPE